MEKTGVFSRHCRQRQEGRGVNWGCRAAAGILCACGVQLQQAPKSWLYSWDLDSLCLKLGLFPGLRFPVTSPGCYFTPVFTSSQCSLIA